jgi:hypothetical protein
MGMGPKKDPAKPAAEVETILIGARIPANADAYFLLPYWLRTQHTAIKNVSVLMQYPSHHALLNVDDLRPAKEEESRVRFCENSEREIWVRGDTASSVIDVSVLRIHDLLGSTEPVRFYDHPYARALTKRFWEARGMGALYGRLEMIDDFVDAIVVDIFVRSENHKEIRKRVNLIWFNVAAKEELQHRLNSVIAAFWRDCYPKTGYHLASGLLHARLVEMYLLPLVAIKAANGRIFYLTILDKYQITLAQVYVPAWNYREDDAIPILSKPFPSAGPYLRALKGRTMEMLTSIRSRSYQEVKRTKARFIGKTLP